ncbi:tetratricopeptide repeat protein [Saccharopolyspora sp. 7B]|uniref:tetratricopeptide repeat protein n=1 Tax=Saccharopolyspora sp. 7B TaxID=2877240 RepID=UPI001CD6E058|nr:tetratricopeptide repeat protein [Saccharopolyspora sp. 7B]MCA1279454.1 tetratricopeptide repeat protein [Saccharopolyspora sp. 7B]
MSSYATAATKIGLTRGDGDEDRASQRFLEWLAETDRPWLIVLDDLHDPGDLRDLWPPQRFIGRVVVTTHRQDASLAAHHRHLIKVGLFTSSEAVGYIRAKLTDRPELAEGAAELADDLGYLPLALAQATAYLLDRNLTCADYRRRLADRRRQLAQLLPETGSLPDDHQDTVAATWSLSLDWANQLSPAGLARPLLQLAAVLDPNGIPGDVFTTAAVQAHLADALEDPGAVEADRVADALQNLRRLSLADIDHTDRYRTVRVHALVQRATRETFPEDHSATLAHAADALLEIWPEIERDTAQSQALRANTDHLHTHTVAHLWHPDAHSVLFRAGSSLGETGLVAHAATYFHHLHDQTHHTLGPDHLDTLTTRNNLASWQGEAGDPTGAAHAFEELLTDYTRILGPDHPDTLGTRNNLASWQGRAGDPTGAAHAFEELLTDYTRILGPDHPDTLTTRNNLAFWRGEAGDPTGAAHATEELPGS